MLHIRFAENLKYLRMAKKLKQKDLAQILNVDQRTISAWEKGVCEPNFACLEKMTEIFDEDYNGLLS